MGVAELSEKLCSIAYHLFCLVGCLSRVPLRLFHDPGGLATDDSVVFSFSWSRIMIRRLLGEPSQEDGIIAEKIA